MPSRTFPSFWTLHLAGWTALGLAMWIGVVWHVEEPARALANKMYFAFLGSVLTLAVRPLYRHLYERNLSIPILVVVSAACSYALSVVWSITYRTGEHVFWLWIDGEPIDFIPLRWLINGALFFSFVQMAWGVLYFGLKYARDAQAERERALRAEALAQQAQVEALRYQLNPHFLFNTMNAISTLIVEERNDLAARMVARLSDFLRATLDVQTAPEVPLAEEVGYARRYLDIEQIRFGDRLCVIEDVDPDVLSARVPPLLLQPLVENAVRHGILPRESGGVLRIEGRRVGDRLLLRVEDDGPGPAPNALDDASGVGLANTRDRLEALYGDRSRLAIQRGDGGGCTVHVELPFHTEPLPDAPAPAPPVAASRLAAPVAPAADDSSPSPPLSASTDR